MRPLYFSVVIFPVLLLTTELLIKYNLHLYAFVFTLLYLLTFSIMLIKSKNINNHAVSFEKSLANHLNTKKTITSLLALPVIVLIMLVFPFKESHLNNVMIVYSILGVMAGIYVINYRLHFFRAGHHFKGLKFIIPGILGMAAISFFNYKYLDYDYLYNELTYYLILAFISYITVLYFRVLIQNFLHSIKRPYFTILYISSLIAILQIPSNSITIIASTFFSASIIGWIYYKSRNVLIAFLLEFLLNAMQYILFPMFSSRIL